MSRPWQHAAIAATSTDEAATRAGGHVGRSLARDEQVPPFPAVGARRRRALPAFSLQARPHVLLDAFALPPASDVPTTGSAKHAVATINRRLIERYFLSVMPGRPPFQSRSESTVLGSSGEIRAAPKTGRFGGYPAASVRSVGGSAGAPSQRLAIGPVLRRLDLAADLHLAPQRRDDPLEDSCPTRVSTRRRELGSRAP